MPERKTARVGKKRAAVKLPDTPAGDVMRFVNEELDRRDWSVGELFGRMQDAGSELVNSDAIYKWRSGQQLTGLRVNHLEHIAKALGYSDWLGLAAAIKRRK